MKKTPLFCLLGLILLSGCETLSHPNTGFNYDWTPVVPYSPRAPLEYYGYYPDYGISRNDFIIATEGGF